jgi:hypothetical protein
VGSKWGEWSAVVSLCEGASAGTVDAVRAARAVDVIEAPAGPAPEPGSEAAPGAGVRGEPGWVRWALLALSIAVFLAHLPVALRSKGPIVLWDEPGYLGNARYLADGFGRTFLGYQSGYSFFLVPAAWLARDPLDAYRLSLVTNALLAATVPFLAFRLSRRAFPAADLTAHLLATGVAATYCGAAALTGVAMSENVFIPLVLAIALAIAVAAEQPRMWYLAAAFAGYATWISPRALIVVAAFAFTCAVTTRVWKQRAPALPAFALCAAVIVVGRIVNRAIAGTARVPGTGNASSNYGDPLTDPGQWREIAANVFGRIAYLGVASLGLAMIGAAVAAAVLLGRRRYRVSPGLHAVSMFALPTIVATVVLGAIGAVPFDWYRFDLLFYGRYTDGVVLPLLVIGATAAFGAWPVVGRQRYVVAGAVAGVSIVSAVLADRLYVPLADPRVSWSRINVIALYVYESRADLVHDLFHTRLALVAQLLAGAAVMILALVACAYDRRVAAALVIGVFAYSTWSATDRFVVPASRELAEQRALVDSVHQLDALGVDVSCVIVDERSNGGRDGSKGLVNDWTFYPFLLPETEFRARDVAGPGCGPLLVSAGTGVRNRFESARPVANEQGVPLRLFVLLDRLPADVRARLSSDPLGSVRAAAPG